MVNQFPRAAVQINRRLVGLKQWKIVSQFWRTEGQNQGVGRVSRWEASLVPLPAAFSLWSSVSLSLRTLSLNLGSILIQCGFISIFTLMTSAKTLFLIRITFWESKWMWIWRRGYCSTHYRQWWTMKWFFFSFLEPKYSSASPELCLLLKRPLNLVNIN